MYLYPPPAYPAGLPNTLELIHQKQLPQKENEFQEQQRLQDKGPEKKRETEKPGT